MAPLRSAAAFLSIIAGVALATNASAKSGKPIAVEAIPVQFALLDPGAKAIGELVYLGGLELRSKDKRFGGFSGSLLTQSGRRLLAVSDKAWWLSAKLEYDGDTLTGVSETYLGPIVSPQGKRWKRKKRQDAEAISLYGNDEKSGVLVGFERKPRLLHFKVGRKGLKGKPDSISVPSDMRKGPNNKELESAGRFTTGPHTGKFIAISEAHANKAGDIKGWIWKKRSQALEFAVKRRGNFKITDLAILKNGDLLLLERRLALFRLPGVSIRLIEADKLRDGATVDGRVLMEAQAPAYLVDNMEGLSVHRSDSGELILTIMSDDNYNRKQQRTLIYQFAWPGYH